MTAPFVFFMKLQILIPQYKETEKDIKPLLDSIALQQNVDFAQIGVIICNDGSDVFLHRGFLDSYPFNIDYHLCKHRGVSATRNSCLDYAEADFVMWCDADDMFFSMCALYLLFRYIDEGFDVFSSTFFEETRDAANGKPVYVKRENDATFVHGKAYRREYLTKNGFRWNEKLKVHEDSYFNGLCINTCENVRYCEDAFYLWRWRDDSVCRKDTEYVYSTYTNLLDSYDALVTELIRRGFRQQAVYYVCYTVFETYYTMNKKEWVNQYRESTEERFFDFFAKWKPLWDSATAREKMKISEQTRAKHIKEGMEMETFALSDWLKQGEKQCQAEEQEKDSAEKE